ncbi:hypothetical protein BSZ39_10885 [Bowdeniella nasicola]|uniref:5'-Nucleotidase C-terminal domain-containing protein n=1 Tax=Bowdeniella nasicola TaxID=208480 RepID=A0A1Q5PZV5_9ACTO|nr:5'-nucleotidase [Bowdeniella nasicola]OKL53168.1 hypothetical protein BSZ39_10885 [Bowdeniella nasicola]
MKSQYGENIAHLSLSYAKPEGATGFYKPSVTKSEILEVKKLGVEPDPAVQAIVDKAIVDSDEKGKELVGYITADFLRGKTAKGEENRGSESTIGNMTADAHLSAANDSQVKADIAVMNPGGIRADLLYDAAKDGAITKKEAAMVQPFANTLMVVELTGAEVKQLLEQQWQRDENGGVPNRPFLKLGISGFFYTYDPGAEEGNRIKTIWLSDGNEMDMKATYKVAANSFLAGGGDNFHVFKGKATKDTGEIDLDATIKYLKNVATKDHPLSPSYLQRSIGIHDANGKFSKGPVESGTPIELDFSSLSFSAEAFGKGKVPTMLACEFKLEDDTVLGTAKAPIDNSVTDAYDETGQAKIKTEIPDLSDHAGKKLSFICQTDLGDSIPVREGTITQDETPTPDPKPTDPVDPKPTSKPKPKPEMPVTGAETQHLGFGALLMVAAGLAVAGSRRAAFKG